MWKSRDITLPTKVCLVKAMVFPVVWMWELDYKESWVPNNWCFWSVVLEKTLESLLAGEFPLDRRSNLSILKEISPEYSLERLMLNLKLQYFGHLMQRSDSMEKTLILGKIEGMRRRGQQRMRWHHWLNGLESEQGPGVGDGQGSLVCCSPWSCRVRHNWATELNWADGIVSLRLFISCLSRLSFNLL